MAVTKGHGNPNWTREEVILALELYNSLGGLIPGPSDQRVIALSEELRSLPYHREASKVNSFRNPAGVAFKLQNIRQVAGGQGLPHTAKVDRAVWDNFGNDKAATSAAARIRSGLKIAKLDDPPGEEFEFAEGRAVTEAHIRIERNKSIRKALLKARHSAGNLRCDVCLCNGLRLDASIRESLFEAHHLKPISMTGPVITRLIDMALLCANCHRLMHRLMSIRGKWIGVEDLKNVFAPPDS